MASGGIFPLLNGRFAQSPVSPRRNKCTKIISGQIDAAARVNGSINTPEEIIESDFISHALL